MRENILKLREERAKLVKQAREVLEDENRTAEERIAESERLMNESDQLKAEIDALERLITTEDDLGQRIELLADREEVSTDEATAIAENEMETYRAWIRGGMMALNSEDQAAMQRRMFTDPRIQAAQSVGTDATGGYTVPTLLANRIDEALAAFGGMLTVADVFDTDTGATINYPTLNETAQKGAIIAENTEITDLQDVTFGNLAIEAYMYHSKIVLVSLQLLQDSSFDIDGLLARLLADRIWRIWNEHFTTGTGTDQPNGIVTASTEGVVAAAVAAITADELIDLEHSVDPAYRQMGAGWMFNDSTLKAVKQLKDQNDQYLWLPGLQFGEPDTILRYPYTINQDIAAMATGEKTVLFGKLDKYLIRRVLGFQLMRLVERYAEYLQVGFIGYARADGDLLDAGTNPVKHLVQA